MAPYSSTGTLAVGVAPRRTVPWMEADRSRAKLMPLVVAVPATVTLLPLTGAYEPKTGSYTLNPCLLNVTNDIWKAPSSSFTIQVTSPIKSIGGVVTSQGEFKVVEIGGSSTSTVTVTVRDSSGVNVSHNGETALFYTWKQLDDLLGADGAPTWVQQASLAASIMDLVATQMVMSMDTILTIEDSRAALEKDKTLAIPGDAFSKNAHPGSPPGNVPDQGQRTLAWTDTSGDKKIGPADDFSWSCLWYWDNDPTSAIDSLIFGTINLKGFQEAKTTTGKDTLLTSAGFAPDAAKGKAGGVIYDDFNMFETLESPAGTFTINTAKAKTLNGGFSISFAAE